jgi:hypothetical protein
LDDIQALGENGQPVYTSALQIRETLRLRKQQSIADVLAIPQPNEAGDRIDWYSPIAGKVTSWLSASDSERASAITQLEQCRAVVQTLCQAALKSTKPGQQLFGTLLAKAIQFPDQNHVYLVDGRPVMTFWGFVHLDKKSRIDALDCLRPPVFKPESSLVDLPLPTIKRNEPLPPLVDPQPAVHTKTPPEAVPSAAAKSADKRGWLRFWWLIPGAALAATLVMQFTGAFAPTEHPAPVAPAVAEKRALPASDAPVATAQAIEPKPVVEDKPAAVVATPAPEATPAKATELPLAPAVATPVAEPAPAPAPVATPPAAAEDKTALTMPSDAVKVGSTKFLNGNWRVVLDMKTPVTGKPPSLKYQIKNGKGTAKIQYGDGMSCKADISAGLMSSGNLVINSRFKAKCSDGSRYQMPEIVCTQPLNGTADCKGRYDANTVIPMTMKRESK